MEIAIADMPEDGCDQVELGDLTLGGVDAFGQPRDRHADVGGEGRRARPQMASGPITVVARLPEPAAVLRLGRPVERPAAEVRDDVAEALRLLGNAGVAAVEFDEQRRHFRQRQFRISVDGLDLQRVEQFDARDRNAGLDRENGRLAGGIDRGKRADAGGDRFRDARQLERELGDDAQRSFRADHQPREIVAGRRLLGAARGGHQLAVGHHHLHRQHVVLHGAVAHRVGARAARRRHAAERGVGAGVDGKEQALVAQLLVERLAGDAGLDHAIEILGVHRQHLVHVAEIDRYAAERRVDVALERGADAERYDRHTVRRADADDGLHVVGVLRKHHRVRRLVGDPGQRIAVLLAHRLRGDDAVAERRGQRGDRRRDRGRIARLYRCLLICCRSRRPSAVAPDIGGERGGDDGRGQAPAMRGGCAPKPRRKMHVLDVAVATIGDASAIPGPNNRLVVLRLGRAAFAGRHGPHHDHHRDSEHIRPARQPADHGPASLGFFSA